MGYRGELKGFPVEIVEKMLDKQEEQGNKRDVKVFEKERAASSWRGFYWNDTAEGYDFWKNVIENKNFNLYFNKYPKRKEMKKSDLKTGMLVEVESLGIALIMNNVLLFLDGGWDAVSDIDSNLVLNSYKITRISDILEGKDLRLTDFKEKMDTYLLWERGPIETIEIAGKKFDKNEVENALKDLKPIE